VSAPERIWAIHWNTDGPVLNGGWADTIRHFGGGIEYVRADLAQQWQNIAAAPKDGFSLCWVTCGGACGFDDCGHVMIVDLTGYHGSHPDRIGLDITHWMPLPKPPEAAQ